MNGAQPPIPLALPKDARSLKDALNVYPFDPELHRQNRDRVLKLFSNVATVPTNSVLLLQGGASPTRYESDHEPIFRQESNFAFLCGVKEPDCFLLLHINSSKTVLFVPKLPESYAIWMGTVRSPASFKDEYKVDEVRFTTELNDYCKEAKPTVVYTARGYNADSQRFAKEASFEGLEHFRVDNGKLYQELERCRMIKTERELRLMAHINRISSEAHVFVMQHIAPGMKEFQLESMFMHWGYFRGQCRHTSYTSICGSGPCGAHLHYGHAGAPNDRTLESGDLCLLDMGAEFRCYTSDITCTMPANGKFTDKQKQIYNAVLDAQKTVMRHIKPGVSYVDMHELAYTVICKHLLAIGILKGTLEDAMRENLGAVFMPHGLGHFMGLDTHDVGGRTGCAELEKAGYKSLRLRQVLQEGMVLTVEPGIYFNDFAMNQALANKDQQKLIDTEVLKEYRGFGGIRIEDDIVVTADGMINLSDCPRTVEEIEAVCGGEDWKYKGNKFLTHF